MRSSLRVAGHPLHPMLVMFPTAMLPLLVFLDALQWWFGASELWFAAFWVAVAGFATAILAVASGIPDFVRIPEATRARRTGVFHAIVGTTVLLTFAAAVWVRWPLGGDVDRFGTAAAIDVLGLILVTGQGWLGAELVYKHHVGVPTAEEGAVPVVSEPRGEDVPARRGGRARI